MTKRELVATQPLGGRVQDTAPQARTERTVRLLVAELLDNDRVGVLRENLERDSALLQESAQWRAVVVGLALLQVHRRQADARVLSTRELGQHVQERVAILAAADRDHDVVASFEQLVFATGVPNLVPKLPFETRAALLGAVHETYEIADARLDGPR